MGKIVFTNGCFDVLHVGHIDLLTRAKALGDKLIVGINSDSSVSRIKGKNRPVVSEKDRAAVLMGLEAVDEVRIFDEQTPQRLIEEISPDILVKGGDWPIREIIGADFVLKKGGQVYSLPLKDGFSSSDIIRKISSHREAAANNGRNGTFDSLSEHLEVITGLDQDSIARCGGRLIEALKNGKKIMLCGNGGSAADAQHIATEIVCRFEEERRGLPAIALTTDTSALTAISNDFGFERIFSRQVEALAAPGDVLIAISTSGNSPNIISAVMKAREIGCITIGMTGAEGKRLASLCDDSILVPSLRTARIQEAHITIGHLWCEKIDSELK